MSNQSELEAFNAWHYADFCRHFQDLPVETQKQVYDAVFALPANKISKENEFKAWQACRHNETLARAKAEADQAEAKKAALSNKVLVDLDELEECYRMAVNHIRDNAVDLDEESALLLSINSVKAVITSHKRNMSDINEYLKRYSDGDVLIVSDRNKFSSKCPSGVRAHWINHETDFSFSDLAPYLNAVKFIHEIFIDKAFIEKVGEDSASDYIGFLIREFKCSATVKKSRITLDDGIFVEVDHAH